MTSLIIIMLIVAVIAGNISKLDIYGRRKRSQLLKSVYCVAITQNTDLCTLVDNLCNAIG